MVLAKLGCTPKGSCDNTRFSEGFSEGFWRVFPKSAVRGFLEGRRLAMGFALKKVSQTGSQRVLLEERVPEGA